MCCPGPKPTPQAASYAGIVQTSDQYPYDPRDLLTISGKIIIWKKPYNADFNN